MDEAVPVNEVDAALGDGSWSLRATPGTRGLLGCARFAPALVDEPDGSSVVGSVLMWSGCS